MPIEDESIRLTWKVDTTQLDGSKASIDAVKRAASEADYQLDGLTNSYEVLGTSADRAFDRIVDSEIAASRALDDFQTRSTAASAGYGRLATAKDRAAQSSRNLGMATLETGRIIQDFSQGGIAGILNNVEGLTRTLGGTAGLAGAITAVGVAAYLLGPTLKELWNSFSDTTKPDLTRTAVDAVSGAVENLSARLKALAEQQSLTSAEVEEFNRLTDEQIQLTKTLSREKRDQAAVDQMRAGQTKEQAERGKAFTQSIIQEGGIDRMLERLLPQFAAREMRAGAPVRSDREQRAALERLFGDAGGGSTVAREEIISLMGISGLGGPAQRAREATPEFIAQKKAEEKAKEAAEKTLKSINDAFDFFDQLGETPQQAKAREKREAAEAKKAQKAAGAEEATDIFIEQALAEEEAQRMDAVIANYLETKRLNANVRAMQQELMSQMVILSEEERLEAIEYMRQTEEFNRQVRAVRRTRQRRGR